MSKRGMRAAGVCLVTLAVMSGSVVANSAVASSYSTLEFAAEDFNITFTATPQEVVLGPNGNKTAAKYRIVVTHPESVDQIDHLMLGFRKGDVSGSAFTNRFKMRAVVVDEPSATSTVLTGHSGFWSRTKWVKLRAEPGYYTAQRATVGVTAGDESTVVKVAPPSGEIRVRYASRTVLSSPTTTRSRVVFKGKLFRYVGGAPGSGDQWASAGNKQISVKFRAYRPVLMTTTRTDRSGEFTVRLRAYPSGRWWVRHPGGSLLGASRSTGYSVKAL